jgi:hippurate hydrolase
LTEDISSAPAVLQDLDSVRIWQEDFYWDLHAHPELPHQEHRTAANVAGRLREAGCEVHEAIGGTGVVGIIRNGEGPTVVVRADVDALPVLEQTGLPCAPGPALWWRCSSPPRRPRTAPSRCWPTRGAH